MNVLWLRLSPVLEGTMGEPGSKNGARFRQLSFVALQLHPMDPSLLDLAFDVDFFIIELFRQHTIAA